MKFVAAAIALMTIKRRSRAWRYALVVLLVSTLNGYAQGAHTLQGRVITPDGSQPRIPVKVTLTYNGRRIYETFTDLSGRFSFTGLAKGSYELTAEGDGATFERTTVAADLTVFGNAPQLFTQDIQLRAVKGTAVTRTAVINAFSQIVPKEAQQLFDRAGREETAGKIEDAIASLVESLKIFPEYFEAHLLLGKLYSSRGRMDQALAELDHAREINPKDDRVYQMFGLVLMRQKNFPMAVAVFSEAVRVNPTNALNMMLKTTALIHQAYAIDAALSDKAAGDKSYILSRAETSLKELSQMTDKKMTPDHLSLAMYYEMKNERRRAADELERYLRENPNLPNTSNIREAINKLRTASPP